MSGTTAEWMSKLDTEFYYKDTSETYARIKALGLKTVEWDSFRTGSYEELTERARNFIEDNAPCLFIRDPIVPDRRLRKAFFHDLHGSNKVERWAKDRSLQKYSFLLTSQITNPGDGYVGTVYSDGKGNVFGETLHSPGVCIHPELSRSGRPDINNIDFFVAVDDSLECGRLPHLGVDRARDLVRMYGTRKGYFELVCGTMKRKEGIYTTGYESGGLFDFPAMLHLQQFISLRLS